jgi:hypothetical protein
MKRTINNEIKTQGRLDFDGYVLHRGIPFDQNIREQIRTHGKRYSSLILSRNLEERVDRRRRFCPLPSKFHKTFDRLSESPELKNLRLQKWEIIHSLPSQEQAPRCDYDPLCGLSKVPDDVLSKNHSFPSKNHSFPCSVIVPVTEGTSIYVWPRTIRLNSLNPTLLKREKSLYFKQKLNLVPGDVLIMRGDLIYAGAEQTEETFYLHVFADSEMVHRIPNRPWLIDRDAPVELQDLLVL